MTNETKIIWANLSSEEQESLLSSHREWLDDPVKGKRLELPGADLSYANLSGANLSGADLRNADLSFADLSVANLSGAKPDPRRPGLRRPAQRRPAQRQPVRRRPVRRQTVPFHQPVRHRPEQRQPGFCMTNETKIIWANLSSVEQERLLSAHKEWLAYPARGKRLELPDANLSFANLSDANLSFANLRNANLSRADLFGAKLRGASLSFANLRNANLSGADLRNANLSRADLFGATLRGADLSDVILSDVILSDADLSGANLSGAKLPSYINLCRANLRQSPCSPEATTAHKPAPSSDKTVNNTADKTMNNTTTSPAPSLNLDLVVPGVRVLLRHDLNECRVVERSGDHVKVADSRGTAWMDVAGVLQVLPSRPSRTWRITKGVLRYSFKAALIAGLVALGAALSQLGAIPKILAAFVR